MTRGSVRHRALDLAVSLPVLLTSSPLLLVVAGAVRLTSRGPALFRQERIGRDGRPFRIHKFRTMVSSHDGSTVSPAGDPRVTPLGRVLRRTKIDELPQLLDVVRGDMAIVGPRPEVRRYVLMWPAEDRDLILSVRPGITDPASIAYRSESDMLADAVDAETCYVEEILPRKVAMYVDYVRTKSVRGDLRIIRQTVAVLFAP